MKLLITGASGLLGTYLIPLLKMYFILLTPSQEEMDITKPLKKYDCDLVLHMAAYTDVVKAEKEFEKCIEINHFGTRRLRNLYHLLPFIYISSEYASSTATNQYGFSKWLGECATKQFEPYLIIRTLFKPRPFPWKKAFIDQYTKGDYVDVIAPLIFKEILDWDRKESKIVHVGTGRKTIFELAKQTRPDVKPCSVEDIKGIQLPKDYE